MQGILISDRIRPPNVNWATCVVFTDGGKDLEEKIGYYLTKPEERRGWLKRGIICKGKSSDHGTYEKISRYLKEIV